MSSAETAVENTRKLFVLLSGYVEKLPRDSKFTIGDRIILRALDVLEASVEAYYGKGPVKIERIDRANIGLEVLRQLLRALFEKGTHNLKKHEFLNRGIDSAGVAFGGWRKRLCSGKS